MFLHIKYRQYKNPKNSITPVLSMNVSAIVIPHVLELNTLLSQLALIHMYPAQVLFLPDVHIDIAASVLFT